jgi:hypothetical protein
MGKWDPICQPHIRIMTIRSASLRGRGRKEENLSATPQRERIEDIWICILETSRCWDEDGIICQPREEDKLQLEFLHLVG